MAEDVELQLLVHDPPQSLVQLVEGGVHRPDLIVEPSVHQQFLALADRFSHSENRSAIRNSSILVSMMNESAPILWLSAAAAALFELV